MCLGRSIPGTASLDDGQSIPQQLARPGSVIERGCGSSPDHQHRDVNCAGCTGIYQRHSALRIPIRGLAVAQFQASGCPIRQRDNQLRRLRPRALLDRADEFLGSRPRNRIKGLRESGRNSTPEFLLPLGRVCLYVRRRR